MKTIHKLALILPFLALVCAWSPARGQFRNTGDFIYTLYPPLNLAVTGIQCAAYVTWQKPQTPGGVTPAGLAGYYIFRDGEKVAYINGADILFFYDYETGWGTFTYEVTANYDLSSYGFPGQFGESPPAGPLVLALNCSIVLPFTEPWDQGSFSANSWQFIPSQSNWMVNTTMGNPAPNAAFNGTPALQNYNILMESFFLPGEPWTCASMFLEFDLLLNDLNPTGSEKLSVQYKIDTTWYTLSDFINTGTTGWIHHKLEFSEVCGHKFRIGFRASGQNSANIGGWSVDNILVHAECLPPTNTIYSRTGNQIHIQWLAPTCDSLQDITGYNVYRTNDTGNPPFFKINAAPVTAQEYTDVIPWTITNGVFKYFITAILRDQDGIFLCEPAGDTITVDYALGIKTKGKPEIVIQPQPAMDYLLVTSDRRIISCELLSLASERVYALPALYQKETSIPVSGFAGGIYLLRLQTDTGTVVRKVVVAH